MIKLIVYVVLILAALGAAYAGIDHVRDTFAQRDKLTAEVATLKADIIEKDKAIRAAEDERDAARLETKAANDAAESERKLRDDLAIESARKERANRENLDHALDQIRRLGAASPALDRCLRLPVPGGLLADPNETVPTTEVSGYGGDDTSIAPAAGAGAGAAETIGDRLILGEHRYTALLNCNGRLDSARAWNEAQLKRATP